MGLFSSKQMSTNEVSHAEIARKMNEVRAERPASNVGLKTRGEEVLNEIGKNMERNGPSGGRRTRRRRASKRRNTRKN